MPSHDVAVDTHDMLLIHRVIRREIGQLPALLRAASGDLARARLVGAHAAEMLDFLHAHHSGEDELMFPLLRDRVELGDELLDRMDSQHEQVDAAVRAARADLPGWTTSADAAAGERMATHIEQMLPALTDHLDEEEERILPLVSQHLSPLEWAALGKHGFASIPGKRRLVILGHIVEETDDAERTRFLFNVPAPARLAYRLIGRRQHARETTLIRG